eukprot:5082729-Pyramimonas_sp.AAC.1
MLDAALCVAAARREDGTLVGVSKESRSPLAGESTPSAGESTPFVRGGCEARRRHAGRGGCENRSLCWALTVIGPEE